MEDGRRKLLEMPVLHAAVVVEEAEQDLQLIGRFEGSPHITSY